MKKWPGSARLTIALLASVVAVLIWINITNHIEGPLNQWFAFGTVGEWGGAVVTALAILVATRQFNKEHRLDRAALATSNAAIAAQTGAESRRIEADERHMLMRAQEAAALVTINPLWKYESDLPKPLKVGRLWDCELHVVNRSDARMFGARARIRRLPDEGQSGVLLEAPIGNIEPKQNGANGLPIPLQVTLLSTQFRRGTDIPFLVEHVQALVGRGPLLKDDGLPIDVDLVYVDGTNRIWRIAEKQPPEYLGLATDLRAWIEACD